MDQMKIVIESLLTGSHFEIAINELDKVLMLKTNIQKILGELLLTKPNFEQLVNLHSLSYDEREKFSPIPVIPK